jgi:hypothetical protein
VEAARWPLASNPVVRGPRGDSPLSAAMSCGRLVSIRLPAGREGHPRNDTVTRFAIAWLIEEIAAVPECAAVGEHPVPISVDGPPADALAALESFASRRQR